MVDDKLVHVNKGANANVYPGEIVTIGILVIKPRHGWFTNPGSDDDRWPIPGWRENLPIF